MTCSEFRRHYSAFRDGVDPRRGELMHAHLDRCDQCRARHNALDIGVRVLRDAATRRIGTDPRAPLVVQAELHF